MNIGSRVYVKNSYFEGYGIIISFGITLINVRITTPVHLMTRNMGGIVDVIHVIRHREKTYSRKDVVEL